MGLFLPSLLLQTPPAGPFGLLGSRGYRAGATLPISYTIGPIPSGTTHISYGIILGRGGDVGFYEPKFEAVPKEQLPPFPRRGKARRSARGQFSRGSSHRKTPHGFVSFPVSATA